MNAETVRTLVVVTIVSVLVWLFAESRTLRAETLTVPVEISAGGSGTVYRLGNENDWAGVIEVEVAGPTGLIDELRRRAIEGIVLEIGDELPAEPGERSVEMIDAIRRDKLFATSGVTVRRVSPRVLAMQTDRVELLGLPVEVDLEGLETAGPVTVEPPEIGVRLPATLAEGLSVRAVAKIPPSRLSALRPGRRTEINQVPIELEGVPPDAWGLRLLEPRVVVTLALRVRTESLTLREIPVRLSLMPADLAVWSVEVPPEDRVIRDVVLTGPVSAIELVRRGDVVPGAIATIDPAGLGDEITEAELAGPVRLVGLPSGVVTDLGGLEVRVVLRRRLAIEQEPPDAVPDPTPTPATGTEAGGVSGNAG